MIRNSLDLEQDSDFWLDPDLMNKDILLSTHG